MLLAAAFLFVLSFIFNKLYTNRSSVAEEVKHAEIYIHQQERDFNSLIGDTALLRRLAENTESIQELEDVTSRKYGVFIYRVNNSGTVSLMAWSNQLALPPSETFSEPNMQEFLRLPNGYYYIIKKTVDLYHYPILCRIYSNRRCSYRLLCYPGGIGC